MKRYSICQVASEVTPFAKTGGLADVVAGLSSFLGSRGHDVRLFMPLYRRIREGGYELRPAPELGETRISFGETEYSVDIQTTLLPAVDGGAVDGSARDGGDSDAEVRVYLIDCPELFDREDLYTNDDDEHLRFALLSRAAIESCQRLQWGPDVFHLNDWHAGLLPIYLLTLYAWDQLFSETRTLMTIHNIGYQGVFPRRVVEELGLEAQHQYLSRDDLANGVINFLKTGLTHADALSTVSRTYADEIQTPEFGMGLEGILRERRGALTGIVNGVDYGDWNPETDPLIPYNYSAEDLSGKAKVKQALLEDFGLTYDERVPLLGIVSRLTGQKGFDLLPEIFPVLLDRHDLRLVVLGSGEQELATYFQRLRDSYPEKVATYIGYNNELAHRIEAGSDLFLMPSRYEPCGLNQMYSLKYGTAPIVRRTGGLADTVEHFDAATGRGTGFVFDAFDPQALFDAISEALSVWRTPTAWAQLVQNGMAQDFSWNRQGREYEALYESIVGAPEGSSPAT